ncbi:MAG TPA: hypothetical protein GXZ82_09690 [Firmicutes bacterium]|jgi:hypothetical protein|nr:hypothetical protein [Bacillota bacterium]
MKKFWIVLALVFAVGSSCFAAQSISIGGGVTKGGLVYTYSAGDYEKSSNLGFYANAAGTFQIGNIPIAIAGSYSSFSAENLTYYFEVGGVEMDEDVEDTYNSSSLLKVFAGYTLPNITVSFGGGFVSQYGYWDYNYPDEPDPESIRLTGFALAAFGSVPIVDKAQIGAQLFYVPKAKVLYTNPGDEDEASGYGFGFEVSGSYQVIPMLALEAGYQSFTSTIKWDTEVDDNPTMATSSIFAGVKFTF